MTNLNTGSDLGRRDFLLVGTGLAVSTAGITATAQAFGPSLSVLVRRWFAQAEAFNNTDFTALAYEVYGETDNDSIDAVYDTLAETTLDKTIEEIIGLPAHTADDALAALDWLVRGEAELIQVGSGGYRPIIGSLVTAIRGYLVAMGGRS